MSQLRKEPYCTRVLRQFLFKELKICSQKDTERSCTQSLNKWQMQDHNCFFLRARLYLLLATPFLAQEEEILNITWLLKDLRLEPSLADGSQPLWIFMLSLGILSHKVRSGEFLQDVLCCTWFQKEASSPALKWLLFYSDVVRNHTLPHQLCWQQQTWWRTLEFKATYILKTKRKIRSLNRLDFQYSGRRFFLFFCHNNAIFKPLNLTLALHSHDPLKPQKCLMWIRSMVIVIHCCAITGICERCSRVRCQLFWTWD